MRGGMFSAAPNFLENAYARFQLPSRNTGQQFAVQLARRSVNPVNDPSRARLELYCFAAAVGGRIDALDPAGVFEPMQERDQRWLFNTEPLCQFSLCDWLFRQREVKQRAPTRLAQAKGFESLVEFQAPRPGGTVQERGKTFWITFFHAKKR